MRNHITARFVKVYMASVLDVAHHTDGFYPADVRLHMIEEHLGIAPRVVGMAPRVVGIAPRVMRMAPRVVGMAPRVVGMAPRVVGMAPRVVGMAPRVGHPTRGTDRAYPAVGG